MYESLNLNLVRVSVDVVVTVAIVVLVVGVLDCDSSVRDMEFSLQHPLGLFESFHGPRSLHVAAESNPVAGNSPNMEVVDVANALRLAKIVFVFAAFTNFSDLVFECLLDFEDVNTGGSALHDDEHALLE